MKYVDSYAAATKIHVRTPFRQSGSGGVHVHYDDERHGGPEEESK